MRVTQTPDELLPHHEGSVTTGNRDCNSDETISLHDFAINESHQRGFRASSSFSSLEDTVESNHGGPSPPPKQSRPSLLPRPSNIARRVSFVEEDEVHTAEPAHPASEAPVTWRSLPRKGQLAILTLARLSEPLTQTSLQAYMFYQLKSFNPSLSDATISTQTGILQGSFTAAQFITAVLWGRAADSDRIGRKRVLLVGLFGTCLSCVGFGLSKNFLQAAIFRTLGGALNGNVGVMRTMISEIIREKKFQSRAFLLLPMCFNVGVIIGPILGGLLADPAKSYPHIFGSNSSLGGKHGVWWMKHWPYALPNLISAVFILISALGVIFGLDETHYCLRNSPPDWGRKVGIFLADNLFHRRASHKYALLETDDIETHTSIEFRERPSHSRNNSNTAIQSPPQSPPLHNQPILPSDPPLVSRRKLWTRNVILTLLVHFILAFHISSFNALIFIFLPTSRSPLSAHGTITGGLGLPASQVGFATAIIGVIGLPLQLLIYPTMHHKLGTLPSYRIFLPFSVIAYSLLPFLVLIPTHPQWAIWVVLTFMLALQVLSRTFALPAAIIMINNCVEDPAVLGTIHGVAQSVSSGSRTLGPMLSGWGLGWGLKHDKGGVVWWCLAVVAASGWANSWLIYEGKGTGFGKEEEGKVGESRETGKRVRS